MDGDVKSNKYLTNQPASVHSYTKLNKSDSPRTHTSPTSILRKFPHSLRHDQKHQTKIKRNSSPVTMVICEESVDGQVKSVRDVKSWCLGDGGESEPEDSAVCDSVRRWLDRNQTVHESGDDANSPRREGDIGFTSTEPRRQHQISDRLRLGSIKKLSVINNSLNEYRNVSDKLWYKSVDKISKLDGKILSPVHKSTPNLLRSEPFGVTGSVSHPERIADRLSGIGSFDARHKQVPLKSSDSLPQLNQKYRIIHSILPKINRTISESHESLSSPRKNLSNVKSDSSLLFGRSDPYQLLGESQPALLDLNASEDERIGLIDDGGRRVVIPAEERQEVRKRWLGKRGEIMPGLMNLVTRRGRGSNKDAPTPSISIPLVTTPPTPTNGSCSSLNSPVIRDRRCDMMYALSDLFRTESSLQIEPMKPINRLRVPPNGFGGNTSRMCSRCSSLLSMASSSRYSINTTGSGFVPCSPSSEKAPEPIILCKLCLLEVPLSQSMEINHCGCIFCKDCMKLYVEFEIQEGAYDISCPDAQCHKQGIVTVNEVELLVATQMLERYMRFRLNHEVDLDRNRTWCPRAGCETVCNICPREKCSPTSVHCPTCDSDFCSNCKNPWHRGLTCEENSKKLAKEGRSDFMEPGIPFDSDLIKCCPMCNVPIEKDEGCAQMMCKRCKHVFCWYCLASLDDDFLLRHYDKGPCKNKLGHTRASVIWHRTQVIGIFAGFGILLLVASPLLLVAAPCIVCCKCRVCSGTKLDSDEDLPEESET